MAFYVGKKFFAVSMPQEIKDKTIIATNKTNKILNIGDKVWINPNYSGTSNNFNINGNVFIDNGIASNFSMQNFLTLPSYFNPGNKNWQIIIKLKTPSNLNEWQCFMGSIGDWFYTIGGELSQDNHFGVGFTSNGTSWDIAWMKSLNEVLPDTWYWIKLSYDFPQYKFELSTDGINYELQNSVINKSRIYQNPETSILNLGVQAYGFEYWKGLIDLNECKIIIDETITWQPYTQTINGYNFVNPSDIIYDSIPGIITSRTSNNSVGKARALLGGSGSYVS